MNKAKASRTMCRMAERELAGWLQIRDGSPRSILENEALIDSLANEGKWTSNWNAAARLMVDFNCYPSVEPGIPGVSCRYLATGAGGGLGVTVLYDDHPDKDTATRLAIVVAVTRKIQLVLDPPSLG